MNACDCFRCARSLKGGFSVFKGMLKTRSITMAGIIAALYFALTWLAHFMSLDSHAVQLRFSEALTILPVLTPAAIPGVTIGCLLANFTMGNAALDVVFGTLATLIGAIGTRLLRKTPYIAWIPPVLSNAIIVPLVLILGLGEPAESFWFFMLTVGVGEVIACGILGLLLYKSLEKVPHLFREA